MKIGYGVFGVAYEKMLKMIYIILIQLIIN